MQQYSVLLLNYVFIKTMHKNCLELPYCVKIDLMYRLMCILRPNCIILGIIYVYVDCKFQAQSLFLDQCVSAMKAYVVVTRHLGFSGSA